jgi:DNA polymerase-3 subunit gamma/tau
MATQALYRRWRSRTFAEILGQDHITDTLLNALRAGRIAHAYLFSGPRGTGKTTTARVLAKAVNCLDPQDGEPCNQCAICRSLNEGRALDLIEIDAASNRGIDEIRDLREKIAFSPNECRYKVYVVDEVHMLTNEAFNALLKTLEEPPPHAIFVLATTAPHKIPTTVLSRCQRFDFRRVTLPHLKHKLQLICAQESVQIQPAALDAIARYAAGSFRDAESLLDQLISYGAEEIKLDDVRRVLGSAPEEVISAIVDSVVKGDSGAGLSLINEALDSGVEPRQLTHEILEHLRAVLLLKNGGADLLSVTPEVLQEMTAQAERFPLPRLLRTVRLFNEASNNLKTGLHSQLPLELALVEATLTNGQASEPGPGADAAPQPEPVPQSPPASPPVVSGEDTQAKEGGTGSADVVPSSQAGAPQALQQATPPPAEASAGAADKGAPPPAGIPEFTRSWLQENWGSFLQAIRPRNRAVEALLKSCEPMAVQGDRVTLGFYHSFHREKTNEDRNRQVIEETLSELAGRPVRVKCALLEGDREQKEQESEAKRREELLDNPVVREAVERYGAKVIDIQ